MAKLLDAWAGETKVVDGRRYFNVNGVWRPQERAVSRPPTLFDRIRLGLTRDRRALLGNELGGVQSWEEILEGTVADGTQISNSTAETIVCPDFNIPAFYMTTGRTLRIWAFGVNSNVVTTPGTLIFRVRWGGVGGTVLLASAAIGLDTTARTNALWCLSAFVTCRSIGASGSFMSGGWVSVVNVLASVGISNNGVFNNLVSMLGSAGAPIASGNAAVTVDTTTAKLLSVTATFSVSTSPTNLTCQQRVIESLN